jgi:hypothetical protein
MKYAMVYYVRIRDIRVIRDKKRFTVPVQGRKDPRYVELTKTAKPDA